MLSNSLAEILKKHSAAFHSIVPFNAKTDKLLKLDFTASNTGLTDEILADTDAFSAYIKNLLGDEYTYGIGGYNEHRTIYSRSNRFDGDDEPRRLHLGIDIWGKAGTPVLAPLDGTIHSFAFNDHYGDYGVTIILHHQLDNSSFHTLYGHLSHNDIVSLKIGERIKQGQTIAHFGEPKENGHWPPHLHFQLIEDMHGKKGNYHGVCKYSEREKYLQNCSNPDIILQIMQYAF